MKFGILALSVLFLPALVFGITAEEIIKQVDKNQVFDSQKGTVVMTIDRNGKKLVKEMKIWGIKEGKKFFVEFTNPEDQGVKYLKFTNELWIYLPDADSSMKISGHMLRQGMMGSDISYEDMMSDDDFTSKYESVLKAETNVNGTLCYDIELTAKVPDVTYYKRRILVDKTKMVALELDLYAKSGRLLKKMTQSDIREYNGHYYATISDIRDMKQRNSITTMEFKALEFDTPIAPGVFSKRNLKK